MYTYGITGTSIDEFRDITLTVLADGQVLKWDSATSQWVNVDPSTLNITLDNLSNVTVPAPASGDFLKWNGSAWVNDPIDLGTDTTGNYVADVAAGTGISVTHTPGEGSTPTVALNSTLDLLSDVDAYATQQWPGPFTLLGGVGAPGAGTGVVGNYYVDATLLGSNAAVLYGPKQPDNSWPLIGTQNVAWYINFANIPPVDGTGWSNGVYYVPATFTPPSTVTATTVYGPYTASGVSERSYLGYNQATRSWQATQGEFLLATEGGGAASSVNPSTSGNFGINPNQASHFQFTLTGNVNFNAFPITSPRRRGGVSSSSHLVVTLIQGGSGGYTVTWPSSVTWPGGVAPVLSSRVGDADVFHLIANDSNTWYGFQVASGASTNNIGAVSTKSADYTLTRGDIGTTLVLDSTSDRTFTIPTNSSLPLPNGVTVTLATINSGDLIVAGASGVTVHGHPYLTRSGEYAVLLKTGTNTWVVSTPTARTEHINTRTADYTFVRGDAGGIVTLDSTTNHTFTVPTNANVPFPTGTRITVLTVNTGNITLAGDTGVTVHGTLNINTQGIIATLIKVGTDTWVAHH